MGEGFGTVIELCLECGEGYEEKDNGNGGFHSLWGFEIKNK
jgi:hypothetical protein